MKLENLYYQSFKTYCKAAVIKTVGYQCKDRQIDQCNKTEFRNTPIPIESLGL